MLSHTQKTSASGRDPIHRGLTPGPYRGGVASVSQTPLLHPLPQVPFRNDLFFWFRISFSQLRCVISAAEYAKGYFEKF